MITTRAPDGANKSSRQKKNYVTEYLFQNYNICPNKQKKYYAPRRRYLSCSDPLTLGRVSAKNTIVAALYIFSFHYIAIAVTLYYCIFVHCYITISLLLPHTQNLKNVFEGYIVYCIVHIWVYLRERPNMTIYKVLKVLFCTSLAQLPMREREIQKVTAIVFCEPCI